MKKLYIILCSVALLAGTAVAQNLDGSGMGQGGPGPHHDMDLGAMEGVPEDILAIHKDVMEDREVLRASRQKAIDDLPEGTTDEVIRETLEEWRTAHETEIEEIRAQAHLVRDWFREHRPVRPEVDQTDGMRHRRQQFRENVAEMQREQRQLRLQLQNPDLTEEEREALIQAFRDENRETMQKLRARKRQMRLEGDGGGDRRGNPGG